MKGGDPFHAHICMSCISSIKLSVFEMHAIGFAISDINDITILDSF